MSITRNALETHESATQKVVGSSTKQGHDFSQWQNVLRLTLLREYVRACACVREHVCVKRRLCAKLY